MGGQMAQTNEPIKRGDSCMPGKTVRFAWDQVHFLKAERTIKNRGGFPFGLKTVSNGRNVGHMRWGGCESNAMLSEEILGPTQGAPGGKFGGVCGQMHQQVYQNHEKLPNLY